MCRQFLNVFFAYTSIAWGPYVHFTYERPFSNAMVPLVLTFCLDKTKSRL